MEQAVFYIGQILGVIAVVLGFVNYQVKTREGVLIISAVSTVVFVLHYLCLGAWAGMVMNFAGLIRNISYYHLGKNGRVKKRIALSFSLVMGSIGTTASILAGEELYFLLSVVSIMIYTFAISFSNPNNIRKSILISSPLALLYNCFVRSAGGAVYEAVAIISSVIGLIRFRDGKKN